MQDRKSVFEYCSSKGVNLEYSYGHNMTVKARMEYKGYKMDFQWTDASHTPDMIKGCDELIQKTEAAING